MTEASLLQTHINIGKNQDILKTAKAIQESLQVQIQQISDKFDKTLEKREHLSKNKIAVIEQIDVFFDKVIETVLKRKDKLKEDYSQIEIPEKRRLKNKETK